MNYFLNNTFSCDKIVLHSVETETAMTNPDILEVLKRIISGMDESLLIFNRSGEILHASFDLRELLHEETLVGKSIFNYLDFDTTRIKNFLNNLNTSKYFDLSIQLKRGGKSFPARVRMASWRVSEDEHIVLASIIDATMLERKRRDLLRKTLTIEQLSRSKKIRSGKLYDAIYEILEMSSKAVHVTRVNAWLFDEKNDHIECIGNYDLRYGKMMPQESLPIIEMPTYLSLFKSEKIILAPDAQNSPYTSELNESYLVPNGIISLMDIPLRSEGEIIGVICFEQVDLFRDWSVKDQKFGLIAAQMVSLAVETHKRKLAQQQLEAALEFQKKLLKETNHRIMNNLALTTRLLQLQVDKAKDDYHRNLMIDSVNRVRSIVQLHDQLNESQLDLRVPFKAYLQQLINNLRDSLSHPSKQLQLLVTIDSCEMKSSLAVALGIIVNEAVMNAYKHAFADTKVGVIRIDFEQQGPNGILEITDNGTGFSGLSPSGGGISIIKEMVDHIHGRLIVEGDAGFRIKVEFPLA